MHTWGHKSWPYLNQLCTRAKAALWSKTLVTGDPTSAIFPICSFSLQSGPGLIPAAVYLFLAGTYYEHLWRQYYNFVSPQRKVSHLFWDSSELQTKAQCIGIAGSVALKSALLIRTKKLMSTYPISPNNACAAGWNSLSSISPFRKAEELQFQGNLNASPNFSKWQWITSMCSCLSHKTLLREFWAFALC